MATIGRLVVEILARTSSLEADIARATRKLDGFQRTIAGVGAATKTMGGAFLSLYAIKEVTDRLIDFGRSVIDVHEKLKGTEIALKTATGSMLGSREEMEYLRQEADRLGLVYVELGTSYKKFASSVADTPLAGQKTRDMFSALAEAGAVFRLSMDDMNGVMKAMTQIMSKGRLSSEELRQQLGERIPGAFKIAAESIGMTQDELNKALEQGKINSVDFAEKFTSALRKTVAGELPEATKSATAEINRLTNAWDDFKMSIAKMGFMDIMVASIKTATSAIESFRKMLAGKTGAGWLDELMLGAHEAVSATEMQAYKLSLLSKQYEELTAKIQHNAKVASSASMELIKNQSPVAYQAMIKSHAADLQRQKEILKELTSEGKKFAEFKSEFEKNKKKPAAFSPDENLIKELDKQIKEGLDENFRSNLDEDSKAIDELIGKINQAKKVYEQFMDTPSDRFAEDIEKLNFLAEQGVISWENFGIASEKALNKMFDDWDRYYNKQMEDIDRLNENFKNSIADSAGSIIQNFLEMKDASYGFFIQNEHRAMNFRTLMIDVYNSAVSAMFEYMGQYAAMIIKNKVLASSSTAVEIALAKSKGAAIATSMAPAAIANSIATDGASSFAGFSAYVENMLAGIAATQGMLGQAHKGLDYVDKEGTYMLDRGERVISPTQNSDLTDYLRRNDRANVLPVRGTGGEYYNINVVVNSNSIDSRGLDEVARTIAPRIRKELNKANRNRLSA